MSKILLFWLFVYEFNFDKLGFIKDKSRLRLDLQICELKLWFSCEIYLNVRDVGYELHFCDRIPNGRN